MPMLRLAVCVFLVTAFPGAGGPTKRFIPHGEKLVKVVSDLKFSEGPAWHPAGFLLFEDMGRNRIMKLEADETVSVYREPSRRSNGLAFDREARLVAAESGWKDSGGRRVSRTEKEGTVITLADRWDGKRLTGPNDLTIDARGCIYFSDVHYGTDAVEQDRDAVYRIDAKGALNRVVHNLTRPNGIVVTHDNRTLYVAESEKPGGKVQLWAFDVDGQCQVENGRMIFDFFSGRGIDGMALDADGRIWAAAGTKKKAGIYVFEPDGNRVNARVVMVIPTPEDPTNCTFGGQDLDTLYITTTTSLFRIRTNVKGKPSPPGK